MTNCHRYRPPIKCSFNRSSIPQANGGWGTIVFIIFILFLISKCSDHHDRSASSGYLPEMPAAPEHNSPSREKEEPDLGTPPFLLPPENSGTPAPQFIPSVKPNGSYASEPPNPSWYIPNETIGSNRTPISPDHSLNPSDEREPAWIIPKEENQRAP
jgi:hypothetical protein